jgi:hypothetical protein
MTRPGFFQGVLAAAALALAAGIAGAVLAPFMGLPATVRLLIPALGLGYLLYLFTRNGGRRNRMRTGGVTALGAWATMAFACAWLAPPLSLYLCIHAGAIWLLRSLVFYTGVLPALLDLALSAASVAITTWAALHSGSLFLAAWCFFLVQALFVAIPPAIRGRQRSAATATGHNEDFERARRQAEAALHQLFTR